MEVRVQQVTWLWLTKEEVTHALSLFMFTAISKYCCINRVRRYFCISILKPLQWCWVQLTIHLIFSANIYFVPWHSKYNQSVCKGTSQSCTHVFSMVWQKQLPWDIPRVTSVSSLITPLPKGSSEHVKTTWVACGIFHDIPLETMSIAWPVCRCGVGAGVGEKRPRSLCKTSDLKVQNGD